MQHNNIIYLFPSAKLFEHLVKPAVSFFYSILPTKVDSTLNISSYFSAGATGGEASNKKLPAEKKIA